MAKQISKTWVLCYFMLWMPQKKAGGKFQKTYQLLKMLHSMQIRMHMVWEYFSTSLVGVVVACEKLRAFFVQYLWNSQRQNQIKIGKGVNVLTYFSFPVKFPSLQFFYLNINWPKQLTNWH